MLSTAVCFFRVLILIFSLYGYIQFVSKKLNADFSAALVLSSIGSILFLAGILNILLEASIIICLCGVILGVMSIYPRESREISLSKSTVFFVLVSIYLVFYLYGRKFQHYDNYTHWAVVTKSIVSNNSFPNFECAEIEFPSYPVGSASFIYYFVKITGINAEWMYMLAQDILITGLLSSLFAFSKHWLSDVITAVVALFLLTSNIGLTDLLVDTLLPCIAAAGTSFCIFYKDCIKDKCFFLIPFTVFAVSVKNSGVFFAAIIVLYALFCGRSTLRANIVRWLSFAAAPFIAIYLWGRHANIVFEHGMNSKHGMSLDNYSWMFFHKTKEDIFSITGAVLRRFFSLENRAIYLLIFGLALFAVCKFLIKDKAYSAEISILALVSLLGYEVGVLGMYLFSMPMGEASYLACYDRYYMTILIYIAALMLIEVVGIINRTEIKTRKGIVSAAAALLFVAASYFCVDPNIAYLFQKYEPGKRDVFDRLIETYNIPSGGKYIITRTADDSGYLWLVGLYLVDPEAMLLADGTWLEENTAVLADYDYLIVIDRDQKIDSFIEEHYPGQGSEVIVLSCSDAAPAPADR